MKRIFLVTVLAVILIVLMIPTAAFAVAPYNWTYSYLSYNPLYGTWADSQTTTYALRFWPSYASSYYRLGNSLSSEFKTACRNGASTWSAVDSHFYYNELPLGSDQYDRTLGMADLGSGGALGVTSVTRYWDSGNVRSTVSTWYTRFEANLYKYGWAWCVGAQSGKIDIQNVTTHEMGHPLFLDDVQGSWAQESRPTMYYAVATYTTYARSLTSWETSAVGSLY